MNDIIKYPMQIAVTKTITGALNGWHCEIRALAEGGKVFGAYASSPSEALLKASVLLANAEVASERKANPRTRKSPWILLTDSFLASVRLALCSVKNSLEIAKSKIDEINLDNY